MLQGYDEVSPFAPPVDPVFDSSGRCKVVVLGERLGENAVAAAESIVFPESSSAE